MNKIIEEFREKLISDGLASMNDLKGCTEVEIRELEEHFNLTLPDLYKDFLRLAGHRIGRFLEGTDLLYKHLFTIRSGLENNTFYEPKSFELTESMFVFLDHQGYILQFFDTSENLPDPPVYTYEDDDSEEPIVKLSFDTFSAWLFDKPKIPYSPADNHMNN